MHLSCTSSPSRTFSIRDSLSSSSSSFGPLDDVVATAGDFVGADEVETWSKVNVGGSGSVKQKTIIIRTKVVRSLSSRVSAAGHAAGGNVDVIRGNYAPYADGNSDEWGEGGQRGRNRAN